MEALNTAEYEAKRFGIAKEIRLVDPGIAESWRGLDCVPPWSVERFLEEMSTYKDDKLFMLTDRSINH